MQPTIIVKQKMRGLSERALADFVAQACRATGVRGAVTVLLTSSRELRRLNFRFRGKAHATDVLSFPPLVASQDFAGDVAISLDIAAQNARELGHSLPEEVQILILHGLLHLAGYDHERDNGTMASREVRLRRRLKLPAGLIERAADAPAGRRPRLRT